MIFFNATRATSVACKYCAVAIACSISLAAAAHVTLEYQVANAGSYYKGTFKVGHGCGTSPVRQFVVTIPAGVQGAKPMPHAGWVLTTQVGKLDKPYDDHGKLITEGLLEVTWTASGKDNWLQDAWYDEFVLRGTLPGKAGPMWFKVKQTCEKGSVDWADVPASGTATKGLKSPAALLEIIESDHAGHQH